MGTIDHGYEVQKLFDAGHGVKKVMSDMASNKSVLEKPGATSGIVLWRHVWRQKCAKLCTYNQLPNLGETSF